MSSKKYFALILAVFTLLLPTNAWAQVLSPTLAKQPKLPTTPPTVQLCDRYITQANVDQAMQTINTYPISSSGVYCFASDITVKGTIVPGSVFTFFTAFTISDNASVIIDLQGFTLRNITLAPNNATAFETIGNRESIIIRNGTIDGFQNNVFLEGSPLASRFIVEKINFPNSTGATYSVYLRNVQFAEVRDIVSMNAKESIVLTDVSSGKIRSNETFNPGVASAGIKIQQSHNIDIESNEVSNFMHGIELLNSNSNTVKGNKIFTDRTPMHILLAGFTVITGIYVDNSLQSDVRSNTIMDMNNGIVYHDEADGLVEKNRTCRVPNSFMHLTLYPTVHRPTVGMNYWNQC